MAMLDYGAIVKKNNRIISDPKGGLFQNFSAVSGGETEYFINSDGENDFRYINDESIRKVKQYDDSYADRSVVNNYMSVVGDKEFLFATYKDCFTIYDAEKLLDYAWLSFDNTGRNRMVKKFGTPVDVKLKTWVPQYGLGTAHFTYKGDTYDILFGYGIDPSPKYYNSKNLERYVGKKLAKKIRSWISDNEKE